MTCRRILIATVVGLAILGAGAVVVTNQHLPSHPLPQDAKSSAADKAWLDQQKKAEEQSERQGIDAACAALHKMGRTDRDCPPE